MKTYVATIDTGGISYSGRTILAVGSTPEASTAAVVRKLLGKTGHITAYGGLLRTTQDVIDYYGIRVVLATLDGAATEEVD